MSSDNVLARLVGGIMSDENVSDDSVDVTQKVLAQQEAEHVLIFLMSRMVDRPIGQYAEEARRLVGAMQGPNWEDHVPALVALERSIFRNLHLQSTEIDNEVS